MDPICIKISETQDCLNGLTVPAENQVRLIRIFVLYLTTL